jgi:uncharacterized protein
MNSDSSDPYREARRAYKRGGFARAMKLYEELAEQGDADGLVMLADIYARGLGVPVDLDKAETLLQRAASTGSAEAVFQLAAIWHDRGDMRRYFLAVKDAAGQGLLIAQFYLGLCYSRGRGVDRDARKADELIRDAAVRGLIRAKTYFARRLILRLYNPFGFLYGLCKMLVVLIEGLTIALLNPDDDRLR